MKIHFAVAVACVLASCSSTSAPTNPQTDDPAYVQYLIKLQNQANAQGLPGGAIFQAYQGLYKRPAQHIMAAEKAQPEFTTTFAGYTGRMVSAQRVAEASTQLKANLKSLQRIQKQTHVHMGTIVALWGLESNFGKAPGNERIIPALASLGYTSHRPDFFQKELFNALRLLPKTGKKAAALTGSWAGAMGQCQFMPSAYLTFGKDGNGDGRIDIWNTQADVFASTANYMQKSGYNAQQPWRIILSAEPELNDIALNPRGLSEAYSLTEWKMRGVKDIPNHLNLKTKWRYFKPQDEAPPMLVGPNFEAILKWNKSSYFAYSVLTLSDTIQP